MGRSRKNLIYLICLGVVLVGITIAISVITVKKKGLSVSSDEYNDIMNTIKEYRHSSIYIKASISENESIAYLYNENGEAYAQSNSGGVTVYRNDDKAIIFGDRIAVGYDITPLRMLELALELVGDGEASITREVSSDSIKVYTIEVKGLYSARLLYRKISSIYEHEMVNEVFTGVRSDNVSLKFTIALGQNDTLGGACYVGIDGTEYLGWYFDGYLKFGDWQLGDTWYEDNDEGEWYELINKLVSDIETITNASLKEKGIIKEDTKEE